VLRNLKVEYTLCVARSVVINCGLYRPLSVYIDFLQLSDRMRSQLQRSEAASMEKTPIASTGRERSLPKPTVSKRRKWMLRRISKPLNLPVPSRWSLAAARLPWNSGVQNNQLADVRMATHVETDIEVSDRNLESVRVCAPSLFSIADSVPLDCAVA
jgi:hypothetical protein